MKTTSNILTGLTCIILLTCFSLLNNPPWRRSDELQERIKRSELSSTNFYYLDILDEYIEYTDSGDMVLVFGQDKFISNILSHFLADDIELKSVRQRNGYFSIVGDSNDENFDMEFNSVIDRERNVSYYVFSGHDFQEPTLEIASKCFLQDVLFHGERLKVVLTLDYESLTVEGISSLLEFTSKLILHPEFFENSILLIITGISLPSDTMESKLLPQYVEEYTSALEEILVLTMNYSENLDPTRIKLLDILSQTDENGRNKFGFVSNPNGGNRLDTVDIFQEQRHILLNRLEGIQFVTASDEAFDFSLSEESQTVLTDTLQTISSSLTSTADEIVSQIQTYYGYKLEESHDILPLLDSEIIPNLKNLKECFSSENDLNNIVICIKVHEPEVYNLMDNYASLYKNLNYLNILQAFIPGDVFGQYTEPLDRFEDNLEKSLSDFSFWRQIYSELLRNMAVYSHIKQLNNKMNLNGIDNLIEDIIHEQCQGNCQPATKQYDHRSQSTVLKKLLQSANFADLEYLCESEVGVFTVKGNFIITSNVNYESLRGCGETITRINFFAFQKIFIDSIPHEIRNISIGMVAPEIDIVNLDLRQYIESSSDKTMIWLFGYMNFVGTPGHRIIFKPCKGAMWKCSRQVIGRALGKYKNYLSDHLKYTLNKTTCINFYREINKRHYEERFGDILGFINELSSLEYKFYNLEDHSDFLTIYESLKNSIESYYNSTKPGENTHDHKMVLRRLYVFVVSRIYAIRNGQNENLVIDIEGYLNLILSDINRLDTTLSKNAVENYRRTYNDRIESKTEDAQFFISDYLMPELEQLLKMTNLQIDALLREISELQVQLDSDEEYLKRKRDELKAVILRKKIMGALSIFATVLNFFGGWGFLIGAVIQTGVAITGAVTNNNVMLTRQPTTLPEGVRGLLEKSSNDFKLIEDKRIQPLQSKIDAALYQLKRYRTGLESSYLKISRINTQLRLIRTNRLGLNEIDVLDRDFDEEMKIIKAHGGRSKRNAIGFGARVVCNAVGVADTSVSVFNAIKDDEAKLERVNEMIQDTQQKREQLKEYEKKVYTIMAPMLHNMQKYVVDLTESFSTQSEISLIVSEHEMKTMLGDVNAELMKMTNGFSVQGDLSHLLEKVAETTSTISSIYKRMEQYRDDQYMANFIADITTGSRGNEAISDPQLSDASHRLDVMIKSNIILAQYKRAVNSFKQYVFPFAHLYLPDFDIDEGHGANDTQYIMNIVKRHVEMLRDGAIRSRTLISTKVDKYLQMAVFHSNYRSTKPFYVWKNKDYRLDISKLLAGKAVYLYADVINSDEDKNAIKFSSIGIELKHKRRESQRELDDILKHYKVNLKHMGHSKYRCDDNYYAIASDDQDISYSFERDEDGNPIHRNRVYDKIKNGTLLLSPYTMWKIQLLRFGGSHFQELHKYRNQVDLQLVGRGQYVVQNSEICRHHLEKYYELENPYYYSVPVF